jgi:hypothetical protein
VPLEEATKNKAKDLGLLVESRINEVASFRRVAWQKSSPNRLKDNILRVHRSSSRGLGA